MISDTEKTTNLKIYKLVHTYCEKLNLFKELDISLSLPEKKRFDAYMTLQHGLSVLHAVHCIVDKNRTLQFLEEIENTINSRDTVLEAGVGTGIMSFAASLKAKKVLGIEINSDVFDLANNIKKHIEQNNDLYKLISKIQFIKGDATRFNDRDMFSVLISENIYTGMFYEKQVQISNSLQKNLVAGYKAIPSKMISYVTLAETIFPSKNYSDKELFVPIEHKKSMTFNLISEKVPYNKLDFTQYNEEVFNSTLKIKILHSGTINSLYITSDVYMPSGKIIYGKDTIFFNNDIVISVKKSLKVQKGDIVSIYIKYRAGDNPHDMQLDIEKIKF